MNCPKCKSRLVCKDTRANDGAVIRIRECEVCGYRIMTEEKTAQVLIKITNTREILQTR